MNWISGITSLGYLIIFYSTKSHPSQQGESIAHTSFSFTLFIRLSIYSAEFGVTDIENDQFQITGEHDLNNSNILSRTLEYPLSWRLNDRATAAQLIAAKYHHFGAPTGQRLVLIRCFCNQVSLGVIRRELYVQRESVL